MSCDSNTIRRRGVLDGILFSCKLPGRPRTQQLIIHGHTRRENPVEFQKVIIKNNAIEPIF